MLLLTSTADIIRIVTSAAVSTITCHASFVDKNADTITPSRTNTNITTAATTTIVAAPGTGVQRNVRSISITNNSSTTATQATVQHFDGTTSTDLMGVTLQPGENLILDETGQWTHHDPQGAPYGYSVPAAANLGFTGTLAETFPRQFATTNSTIGASGTLFLQAIYLTAGQLVSNITMFSATTAAATTTNLFFALYSGASTPALLAQSANQGAYTWAANTSKTLAMTTPYRVPTSGLYYVGVMQAATTIATLLGGAAKLNAIIASTAPIIHGTSTTGLTTALPNPAASITAGTASLYAAVS